MSYVPSSSYYATRRMQNVKPFPPSIREPKKEDKIIQEEKRRKEEDDEDKVLFEIFGLELHYDDILLICLIFFLYQEGVKDQYLFIALILLLLS